MAVPFSKFAPLFPLLFVAASRAGCPTVSSVRPRAMFTRVVSLLIGLVARVFVIVACGLGALLAIDAWQHAALPSGTTFGIVFDRLEWAIYGAFAAGLISAAVLVLLQARRFSLTERVGMSFSAAILAVGGFFWFAV